ncbi:MAG: hypothetical protein HY000_42390, partial [Planctomycetes bacterium]|nr:hypothetical protein [Planctomycetota bacterium]
PGKFQVGLHTFPTIERGVKYVNFKKGDYVMVHSWKRTKRIIKCLRPVIKQIDTLLIHDALYDSGDNLTGCVAPGMEKRQDAEGIMRSASAMEEIWKLLGGFEEGKQCTLHVVNNVPGETRTKETWGRLK